MPELRAHDLPPAWTRGAEIVPISVGRSAASVFRLEGRTGVCYAKLDRAVAELAGERDRIRWLGTQVRKHNAPLRVADVLDWQESDGFGGLLTSAVSGPAAHEPGSSPQAVIETLARAIAALHTLPIQQCPFDHALVLAAQEATERTEAGAAHEDDFEPGPPRSQCSCPPRRAAHECPDR